MNKASWKKRGGFINKEFLVKNKKPILIGVVVLALLVSAVLGLTVLKKVGDKREQAAKQKVEESRQMRMSAASWSRVSFFESLPINVTLAMPDYLEGNYRLVKGSDTASFLYIKDPSIPTPLFYIKVSAGSDIQLSEGEVRLSSDCSGYDFAYKVSPGDAYAGADREAFAQAIYDLRYFLENDGYFECRLRQ